MESSLLILVLGAAALFMLSKKDSVDNGGNSNNGGNSEDSPESTEPNIDPGIPKPGEYDENDEMTGVKCDGTFYFGNISFTESQGQFRLRVTNISDVDYKIVGASATVYYQGVMVGFKNSLKLEDLNYTLMRDRTLVIDFPHTPVYFTTKRQTLYDSLPKNGLGLNKTDQELGNIFRADVRLKWLLRKGAGTPIEAYYQEVPVSGVFRSDHFYF